MASSADILEKLFAEEKKLKGRHSPENLFRQARKVVERQATEVMVKMTGAKKGAAHLEKHLSYTTREGELEAENQNGDVIDGEVGIQELVAAWTYEAEEDALKNRRTALSFVFSMPAGTDVDGLKEAVRQTAKERFTGHDYFMVLHDEHVDHGGHRNPNPHVHLTVNAKGFDGKQLHLSREATRLLRETFADRLEEQGIAAQATSRHVRGVTKKGVNSPMHHMAARGAETLADKIKADMKNIVDQLKGGQTPLTDLDRQAIARQKDIRKEWVTLSSQLMKEDPESHRDFSKSILNFVKSMPLIETQRQSLVKQVESVGLDKLKTEPVIDVESKLKQLTSNDKEVFKTDR